MPSTSAFAAIEGGAGTKILSRAGLSGRLSSPHQQYYEVPVAQRLQPLCQYPIKRVPITLGSRPKHGDQADGAVDGFSTPPA